MTALKECHSLSLSMSIVFLAIELFGQNINRKLHARERSLSVCKLSQEAVDSARGRCHMLTFARCVCVSMSYLSIYLQCGMECRETRDPLPPCFDLHEDWP